MPKVLTDKRPRLELESLESRLLLSLDVHGLGPLAPEGGDFGIADPYFMDPRFRELSYDTHFGPLPAEFFLDGSDPAAGALDVHLAGDLDDQALFEPTLADPLAAPAAANRVLFLDFDGARVSSRSGDFWLGSSPVDIPAYDLDLFGWGGREAESINHILQFVAEDYAAYNLTVTATEPASGEYTTIFIGGNADWYQAQSGIIGVATYDVGNRDDSNYGFAFTEELGIYASYSSGQLIRFSEYVANLVSHEAAHTFGLTHISDTTELMNPWLPTSPRRSMFGSGPISGGSGSQDSQSLLGTNLGYAHGPDDYVGLAAITPGTRSGMIERRDDVDTFRFTPVADGAATVSVATTAYGNLDAFLRVTRVSDGAVLVESDGHDGRLDPFAAFDVIAGQGYDIRISSVMGDSSGTYGLQIGFQQSAPAPDLVISDSLGAPGDGLLSFPTIMVGDAVTAQVTLRNAGAANLVVSGLGAAGAFSVDPLLRAADPADDITIPAGASRLVNVTFTPSGVGDFAGQLNVASSDPDTPLVAVTLTGHADPAQPDLNTASSVAFGQVLRGSTDTASLDIANTGQDDLVITAADITAPFTLADWAGEPLVIAPGTTHSLDLAVTSLNRGALNGTLTLQTNDPDEATVTVNLTAQVLAGILAVHETAQTPNDSRIDLGLVRIGESSIATVTLKNNGDADLLVTDIAVAAPFAVEGLDLPGAGLTLAPGQAVTFDAAFEPDQLGAAAASLVITTDDPVAPETSLALTATGVGALIEVHEADGIDDGVLDTGAFQAGQTHQHNAWRLANNGTAPIAIDLSLALGTHIRLAGPATVELAPGQEYLVPILVDTDWAGPVTDTLTLAADDLAGTTTSLVVRAQGYAVLAQGQPYRFTDQSGDLVTVVLSGGATGTVTLGAPGLPDISCIDVNNATGRDRLRIQTRGRTRLASLDVQGDLAGISARGVDLVGLGANLDGAVTRLQFGNLLAGADIDIAGDVRMIRTDSVIGDSTLDIHGELGIFFADEFEGATLRARSVKKALFRESYDGDLEVTDGDLGSLQLRSGPLQGRVQVAGSIGSLRVADGDLLATVTAGDDIDRILAPRGAVTARIQAGNNINRISAYTARNAQFLAGEDIGRLNLRLDPIDTILSTGI